MERINSPQRRSWREIIRRHWSPTKIHPPTVDPDLEKLNGPQRTAEVLRYTILSLEWWLSPNGRLREWLKLQGKISSILLIPAVLVIPLVTFIIWQGAIWVALLVQIAGGLIVLPLAILLAGICIAVVVSLIKAALRR